MSRLSSVRDATAMRSKLFWLTLLAASSLSASLPSARAAITSEGDISPSDPLTWNLYSTDAYIGNTANGTLTIDDFGRISSHLGYIGYGSAATGVVNINGLRSRWRTYGFCVGYYGSGTLSLADGGNLLMERNSEHNSSYIGYSPGSTGLISVDGPGSALINEYDLYVGNSGSGTISITNGGTISNSPRYCESNIYIGYGAGSNGVVAVDGTGSIWNGYGVFHVGCSGNGTLSITDGAGVYTMETWVGVNPGSTGSIDFGANGGTLTTGALLASPNQLTGNGTIITRGLVSDIDLIFDSTHGLEQSISWRQSGQNVTINLNATETTSALGAGWKDKGSLSIRDGITVNSYNAYLGYGSGSTGVATVSGSGSNWNIKKGACYVGNSGSGTLSITNGGSVDCNLIGSYIGNSAGSKGVVTVDGPESVWNNTLSMIVGNHGSATLAITNGAGVTAVNTWVAMNPGSTGIIDFGTNGGTLTTGSLFASPTELAGNGTIFTKGLVSDIDLKFDASHGLEKVISFQEQGQNVTVCLDATGTAHTLGAGWKTRGSLAISDGITVKSSVGYLGYASGSTGSATVSGNGSTWNVHRGYFSIGHGGSGTLSITDGGIVNFGHAGNQCMLGGLPGANGAVIVDGTGSRFNVGHSSFAFVGGEGNGTLSVTNGGSASGPIWIAGSAGSKGVVTVDGDGSNWSCLSLMVGYHGSGTLSITNGGRVDSSFRGYIGQYSGSTGTVNIDGAGSTLTTSGQITVGNGGSGTFSISGGGTVSTTDVSVGNSTSLLAIDVGRGSSLMADGGAGTIVNNGSIRIVAGTGIPADGTQYSPISAATWSGGGTYQPVGGTWDATNHKFTVSSVNPGTSGSPVSLNLASVQRALVSDTGTDKTGWVVGASFLAAATQTDITFTATPISDTVLDALMLTAGRHQDILSGWTFSTAGYDVSSNKPIYLSFDVGADYPSDSFEIWHYDGSLWTNFDPTDLTHDGTYASFTTTDVSGYAITAIPEPGEFSLLAAGLAGLLTYVLRKRK